ncbi:MAG: hypothetical protein K0S55_671 [Clostridia bacterium]|nr:hypothetical protein [Clostridia bacterium]
MRIIDVIRLAFKNLFRRKARTMLTVLGILIGATSVIIMISIGLGLDESKKKLMAQFTGLEVITVNPYWGGEKGEDAPKNIGVLNDAAVAQFEQIKNVKTATPEMRLWGVRFVSGKLIADWVDLIGVKADSMPYFEQFKLKEGTLLPAGEEENDPSVFEVVMGYELPFTFYNPKKRNDQQAYWEAERYMGEGEDTRIPRVNAMTDSFKITFDNSYGYPKQPDLSNPTVPMKRTKFYNFKVVGYLDYDKGYESNNALYLDINDLKLLKAEQDKYNEQQNNGGGGGYDGGGVIYKSSMAVSEVSIGGSSSGGNQQEITYDTVKVRANNMNDVADIQKAIEELGFSTYSYMSYVKPLQDKIASDQFLFLSIGCIAFLVAALNIINTMMMSTYERTREIGIMKVLGCKIRDIRDLFLLEAGLLGVVGGTLGVPISYIVSYFINYMQVASQTGQEQYYYDPTMQGTSSVIPVWLCVAAIVFSALVGFISGLYPSIRAMHLSALDAIKNE